MKKLLSKRVKDMKAITLIALVITIVVLIILAAVAINLSLGNNGIFNRAKTAKEQYQNAQDYEEEHIAKYSNEIELYANKGEENQTLLSIKVGLPIKYKGFDFEIHGFDENNDCIVYPITYCGTYKDITNGAISVENYVIEHFSLGDSVTASLFTFTNKQNNSDEGYTFLKKMVQNTGNSCQAWMKYSGKIRNLVVDKSGSAGVSTTLDNTATASYNLCPKLIVKKDAIVISQNSEYATIRGDNT